MDYRVLLVSGDSCCNTDHTLTYILDARALRLGDGYRRLPATSPVPIVLDNLRCNGSESRLTSCRHNGIGVHNCDHNEDAGLQCGM